MRRTKALVPALTLVIFWTTWKLNRPSPPDHPISSSNISVKYHKYLGSPVSSEGLLTQFYGECRHICTLTEWMDRMLRLG